MSPTTGERGDDLSALAWVHDELRRSLEAAHKSLRRFVREAEAVDGSDLDAVDPAVLRSARAQIHQGVGALELVGLPAAASVLRASEALVQRVVAKPHRLNAEVIGVVEHASFALLDYLGRLLAGRPVSALSLFPQYRAVQEAAGAERVHPADLWSLDWQWRDLPADASTPPRAADTATRGALESQLLTLMKTANPAVPAARMSDLCAGLGAGAGSPQITTFWNLAAAVFEAQAQGLLGFDVFSKRVASRLLVQLRALERGETEVSERLAQDLLFFCAQSESPGDGRRAPRLAAVRQAWGLAHYLPADYAASPLGRFDPALVIQARKRVAAAKEAWSAVAGGEMHRLTGLSEQFALVGESLKRLFPFGETFSAELQQAVLQTQQGGAAPPAPLAMEVATSLLYIEAALEDGDFDNPEQAERVQRLAERLHGVRQGAAPEALEGWMEELYRRVSDRQTMGSVVQELRASLSEVEKSIDQFFRDPANHNVLLAVPNQLSAMRGVLSVLGMDHASSALLRMRDEVDGLISTEIEPQHVAQAGVFDRLAGNLGALGFLIDMLSVQPQMAKSLFRYDAEAGVLSPVMGREVHAPPAGLPPAPAAPVEQRLIEQAQSLAFSSVREDIPLEAVSRDIDRLSHEALAADQPMLAATVQKARDAIDVADDDAGITAARGELSEALVDFVHTATEPMGLDEPVAVREPLLTLNFDPTGFGAGGNAASAAPVDSGLGDDPEMREVFLEEAREVLADAAAARGELYDEPDDLSLLTTLRRAFHTLKGSSRMVGLKEFGEAAWACEQIYNTRLAEQKPADGPLFDFTAWSLDYLGAWVESISAGQGAGHDAATVQAAADTLASGGATLPAGLWLTGLPADLPSAADLDLVAAPVVADALAAEPVASEPPASEALAAVPLGAEPTAAGPPAAGPPALEPAAAREPAVPDLSFDFDPAGLETPFDAPARTISAPMSLDMTSAPLLEPFEFGLTEPAALSDAMADAALSHDAPDQTHDATMPADLGLPEVAELDADAFDLPSTDEFALQFEPVAEAPVAPSSPLAVADSERGPPDLGAPETSLPDADEPAVEPVPVDAPATVVEPLADAAPADEPAREPQEDEQYKTVGPLRIGIPLFNIYLNEADELSRRLSTEVAEWAMELHRPIGEVPIALAHSLAGSSATVGFADLSHLARSLEHAQTRSQAIGHGTDEEGRLFVDAADEIRRLLHQFAAGFLRQASPELLARLTDHERSSALRLEAATAAAEEPQLSESGALVEVAESEIDTALPAEDASVLSFRDLPSEPASGPEPEAAIASAPSDLPGAADAGFEQPADDRVVPADTGFAAPTVFGLTEFRPFGELPVETPRLQTPFSHELVDADDRIDAVDAIDTELFPIFEEEAEELLPQLSSRLRDWLQRPADPAPPAACMRTLHTLKGGARLAGAMRLGEMAHRLETRIERLLGAPSVDIADVELLQHHGDALSHAFDALRHGDLQAQADAEGEFAEVGLQSPVLAGPAFEATEAITAPEDAAAGESPVLPATQPTAVVELAEAGGPTAADTDNATLAAQIALAAADLSTIEAAPFLTSTPTSTPPAPAGELPPIDWSPFVADGAVAPKVVERGPGAQSSVRVRAPVLDRLVNQAGEVSITRSRIEAGVAQIKGSLADLTENLDRLRAQLRDIEFHGEVQMSSRMEAAKAASESFDPLEFDRFTRFQELTRMMAESVNDVATVQRTVQRAVESTEDDLVAQSRLTRDLQDDLLRTRMVEFEGLSDRLYRVVRQAAKETGKSVRLDIVGGGVEVDRGVLDRMTGAFEHMLRNSVTHGIEKPEQRAAAAKDPTGSVIVALTHEGNEVGVEFRDDGAGLNLARIRDKAVALRLIEAEASASDAELANLIFMPGFTTADGITELAGRGVGLDVVRSEVAAMGGRVETSTSAGQGTSFKLILPLTTAVTQVVMLSCGQTQVAVPSTLVEAVQRVAPDAVDAACASGTITFGDSALPFYWLGALLQGSARPGTTAGRTRKVVVIRSAQQRIALSVDDVLGNHEVVVKNLGPQLSRMPGLAGVTMLASGAVTLIYNPVALATLYGAAAQAATQAAMRAVTSEGAAAASARAPETPLAPLVMVVDDSLTVRRVTQRLLSREGYRVTLAKDGLDALERLAEAVPEVVLSDIEMPRMDGFDLVRNMRADARLRDLPVIMITSRIAQKHRDYAAELGVDHYLGKPYAEEDLLALVARYTAHAAPREPMSTMADEAARVESALKKQNSASPVRAELVFPIVLSLSKEALVAGHQSFDRLRTNGS